MAVPAKLPPPTLAEVQRQLERLSRAPFRGLLARVMDCEPDPISLQMFAEKHPDRWAQMLAIIGRLSGYHEKLEIEVPPEAHAKSMSMSQIMKKINDLDAEIKALGGKAQVIEGEEVEADELPSTPPIEV